MRTAERIIGTSLPSIQDIAPIRCMSRARNIIRDSSHPHHGLFSLLASGKRFRSIRCRTTRFCNSFIPQAIRLLNSDHYISILHLILFYFIAPHVTHVTLQSNNCDCLPFCCCCCLLFIVYIIIYSAAKFSCHSVHITAFPVHPALVSIYISYLLHIYFCAEPSQRNFFRIHLCILNDNKVCLSLIRRYCETFHHIRQSYSVCFLATFGR